MSNDCQWVESRLEDYLFGSAGSEARTRIESHLGTCSTCRKEVEGYAEIDNRVRAYFGHQLARAERGTLLSLRPMRLAAAFAGVGTIALALWVGMGMPDSEFAPALEEAALADATYEGPVLKTTEGTEVLRAKPAEGEAIPELDFPATGPIALAAPFPEVSGDFYVTDAAGYSQTLADYSGSILVLGVFNKNRHNAFEEAHAAYGRDARIKFVGVSLNSDLRPDSINFPLMANRGSSLLETPAGAFTIVGPDGTIFRRGLFDVDSLVDVLGSSLEELGKR
jgi:hypothetical protein